VIRSIVFFSNGANSYYLRPELFNPEKDKEKRLIIVVILSLYLMSILTRFN